MDGNRVMQTSVRRVGFRQIEVRGNQVFVNNHPIKLRGACHHEVMPLRGRSVNNDMWRRDVELFREGNVNYLRTSHYPPDEALLEACDELGMFVEVEAPFCWAHEAKVPDALRQDILVNQHLAMVNLNRSHPSVLMWSMGNESNLYAEYFKEAAGLVKQIDPTRPRIFSQWGPDADQGELEVTNHHYPGPEGPDKYRNYSRMPITAWSWLPIPACAICGASCWTGCGTRCITARACWVVPSGPVLTIPSSCPASGPWDMELGDRLTDGAGRNPNIGA